MATHNSLFADTDVHRHPEGIAVSIQLPWYRSLWLSAVDDVSAKINGVEIPKESLRFELQGRSYTIAELPEQFETLWFVADKPQIIIPIDPVPEAGASIDVDVTLTMRLLYMQIAPMRYVGNRVQVEREVVLA
ncbi:C-glycoside deglycosidase beta subunit domain-containing protein [Naasia lichenicola]|uniref:C-deglycosylation enzyme beta subunit n=1 Tax=Naasia lichenicola TaxID=2565933 RepID=A0A4S4FN38_9MICO|nr:DUF6379 domain-containing protein [Naasia lichenicola]THG31641.1 hypothetical protein E6C64_06110 [Naasia lichenicola]